MKLSYAFHRPSYPILCKVPGNLVWAQTRQQLEQRLSKLDLPGVDRLRLIDANGAGRTLYLAENVIAPSIDNRRLKKTGLFDLFRESAIGRRSGLPISEDVARKKRIPELILMIVEWLKP